MHAPGDKPIIYSQSAEEQNRKSSNTAQTITDCSNNSFEINKNWNLKTTYWDYHLTCCIYTYRHFVTSRKIQLRCCNVPCNYFLKISACPSQEVLIHFQRRRWLKALRVIGFWWHSLECSDTINSVYTSCAIIKWLLLAVSICNCKMKVFT